MTAIAAFCNYLTSSVVGFGMKIGYLASHLIDPVLLRADSFDEFMTNRQSKLLKLIEQATGKTAYIGDVPEEGEDIDEDEDTMEAEHTIKSA